MPNPTDPYASTPQQLFSPEEYEKMKQQQAMAQQAAKQPPPQVTPPAPQVGAPGGMAAIIQKILEALGLGGLPEGQKEPQKVEEVPEAPVKDPEEREVRTMEERAKKPLADTKGALSPKKKKK